MVNDLYAWCSEQVKYLSKLNGKPEVFQKKKFTRQMISCVIRAVQQSGNPLIILVLKKDVLDVSISTSILFHLLLINLLRVEEMWNIVVLQKCDLSKP